MAGPGDPGGAGARVLIAGRQIAPVAVHTPDPGRAARHQADGLSTPTLYELPAEEAGLFHDSIAALTEDNPYAASVTVYPADEYAGMRLLMTDDGKAGIALRGDEVVSVFSRRGGNYPSCGQSLVATAVAAGGRRLDCFDTALPHLYALEGFRPVARMAWDDEYAPDGWDYDLYRNFNNGRPDVVFMRYDPDRVDSLYAPDEGGYVTDYDAGLNAAQHDPHQDR